MSEIDVQNAKSIRDTMSIAVTVGDSTDPLFSFDNSNIISCELQLRSDLQPIDPSLPESEIVIKAYWPEDISEGVVTIADDTLITYQAGYEGDMSPVRTFYLTEQIQWADNVLTVHGVDAVHFLDMEHDPIFIGHLGTYVATHYYPERWGAVTNTFMLLEKLLHRLVTNTGVTLAQEEEPRITPVAISSQDKVQSIIERQSTRETIANLINLCHQEFTAAQFGQSNYFWLSYVDAGRPTITSNRPTSKYTIYEIDCADIKRKIDKKIAQINANTQRVTVAPYRSATTHPSVGVYTGNQKVGSADLLKNQGAGFRYDTYTGIIDFVLSRDTVPEGVAYHKYYLAWLSHPNKRVYPVNLTYGSSAQRIGTILRDEKNSGWQGWSDGESETGVITDSYYLYNLWDALIEYKYITDTDSESISIDLYGSGYNLTSEPTTYTRTRDGITANPSKTRWNGRIMAKESDDVTTYRNVLPWGGFNSLFDRSTETGSFTWKGDPRMQPRDVFTFVYRDGTEELRTIETISLKHENGGTVATITYRKGIV